MVCKQHFSISLNRLVVVKVILKSTIRFSISSVRTSEFCPQIPRSLAYGVRISSKASVTAEGIKRS